MKIRRRRFLQLAALGALGAMPRAGWAQSYPSRPITLVVFTPPGGAPDIVGRLIGQALSQRLGQAIVVENRPGAGGNLALQAVARAPADGYTLLLVATPHAVNVTLYEKSNVNVSRDLVPVGKHQQRFLRHAGQPVAAGQNRCRICGLHQGQSGQGQHVFERHRQSQPSGRRVVPDDDRRRHDACPLSRHAGRADRADDRRRSRDVRRSSIGDPSHQGRQAAGAWRDDRKARQAPCPTYRPSRRRLQATRSPDGSGSAPPPARLPKSSTGSTKKSTPCSPIPRLRHGSPASAAIRVRARPPNSANSSRRRPRSGARWSGSPASRWNDRP